MYEWVCHYFTLKFNTTFLHFKGLTWESLLFLWLTIWVGKRLKIKNIAASRSRREKPRMTCELLNSLVLIVKSFETRQPHAKLWFHTFKSLLYLMANWYSCAYGHLLSLRASLVYRRWSCGVHWLGVRGAVFSVVHYLHPFRAVDC